MDVKTAAPLFCAGVTAFHGVQDCELQPGQWMVIVGCGGLGHMGVQYAKSVIRFQCHIGSEADLV